VDDERERAVQISGVAVLHDLFELVPQGRGKLDRRGRRLDRRVHESSDRFRAVRQIVLATEPLEERLFLEREAHAEEVGRGSWGSSGPHAFNRI
jgi:hypothetical protein